MKWTAKRFVDEFGLDFSKEWFNRNIAWTPTHGKYVDMLNDKPVGIISTPYYGGFHTELLYKEILKRDPSWKHKERSCK